MKRAILFFLGLILVLLGACTPTNIPSNGAVVNVYRPNPIKENMVCSSQNAKGIAYMYVGTDTITGKIPQSDKEIIAQYARAVLGETRFINPVTIPAMNGEYPDLSIRVQRLSVTTKKESNRIIRDGVFQANFSIRQAGMLECSTAAPVLIEKKFQEPIYKADSLPSDLRIKEIIIKEAVRKVVRQFVPVKTNILRPVKADSEFSKKASAMINAGNCRGAYELIRSLVNNPQCKDAPLIYDAGVALECMAWTDANDVNTQISYLNKALKYYQKAAVLTPTDQDMQRAMRDVSYELNTAFAAFKRQKTTKKLLQQYRAPTGY